MPSPAHGALRLLRAGGLALIVLGVAAVAHLGGGGTLPPGPLLGLLAGAVVWACVVATRWRLSPRVVVVLLAVSQVGLHEVFMALCQSPQVPASMASMASMGAPGPGLGAAAGTASSAVVMFLCHLAGTAVLAGVYARGEQALWVLWTWLAPLVTVLVALVRTGFDAPRGVFASALVRRHACELFVAAPRRGPPALVGA